MLIKCLLVFKGHVKHLCLPPHLQIIKYVSRSRWAVSLVIADGQLIILPGLECVYMLT